MKIYPSNQLIVLSRRNLLALLAMLEEGRPITQSIKKDGWVVQVEADDRHYEPTPEEDDCA